MGDTVLIANAEDGSISTLRLHQSPEPRLEVLATTPGWPGCGTFAVDAERDLVYAAAKGEPNVIATLSLDRDSGALTETARREVPGSMTYLALALDGRLLLGASYSGGFLSAWPVADGRLGEPHSRFEYNNLHCIIEADGAVYAPALGDDLVAQFSLGNDGQLTPLDPPTVAAPEGSGPRHIVMQGENAYLVTEFSGEVIRYSRGADGALTRQEAREFYEPEAGLSHSRFGADPLEEHLIWGADAHLAGGLVLATERTESTLASIALDEAGHLGEVAQRITVETQPRGFYVTADGQFAVVVGERETHASLIAISPDGTLKPVDRVPIGAGANWVRIF